MTIEEAIKTAIALETKIRDVYEDAAKKAENPKAKGVFGTLAKEEGYHLRYLNDRMNEWKKSGNVTAAAMETVIPSKDMIDSMIKTLKKKVKKSKTSEPTAELDALKQAQAAEIETSSFYKQMVSTLSGEVQKMFSRFVEIEEGHLAIVNAELNTVTGLGFWFDMQEFDLEAG